jgi:hypothetical protein
MPRHRSPQTKSIPRIMLEVTEKQFSTFKQHLPYGFQKQLFAAIVEDMCRMWEEFGDDFTRAVIAKNISYRQFMDDYMERTYGNTPRFEREQSFPGTFLGRTTPTYQRNPSTQERKEREERETQQAGQSHPSDVSGGNRVSEEYC